MGILIVAVIGWASAQILKVILHVITHKRWDFERLLGSGGMPSSHSATVCSLAVAVSKSTEGINSPTFALAIVLALVVMYDAMGVRRAAGLHAKEINRLNRIVSELDDDQIEAIKDKIDQETEKEPDSAKALKEFLGHSPTEVLFGALLGILVGLVVPIFEFV
jgi:acid phosphatase family membrane protein YuiD